MTSLLRAVVNTDQYRVGSLTDEAGEEDEALLATRRILTANQLADAVEDLTGFRWEENGFDQLENDLIGFRVMVGGVDGHTVTSPDRDPTMTRLVVTRRLAQSAAAERVEADLALPAEDRLLLGDVDALDRPGDGAFEATLSDLYLRIQTREADDEMLAEDGALWDAVYVASLNDDGDEELAVQTAWTSLISHLMRDPAFWVY